MTWSPAAAEQRRRKPLCERQKRRSAEGVLRTPEGRGEERQANVAA